MKTLYLHIGTPKTGTSAIQDFLTNNEELLEKNGYCYKLMPYKYTRDASIKRNGHFLVGKIYDKNGKVDRQARKERIKEGMELVTQWFETLDSVILSDEGIWNAMAKREHKGILAYVKSYCVEHGFDLKIIVYVRSQDDYVLSWWRQRIRSGSKLREWDYFVNHLPKKKLVTDYYAHLNKIAQDVGKENLIVRRYEKGSFLGSNHTIFSDFLDAIGLEYTDDYIVEREYVNTSMENNYAEIKRILNNLLPDENQPFGRASRYFENIAIQCSNLENVKQYESSMFSDKELEEFLAKYEEGNRNIAKEFLGEDGELFTRKTIELPKWERTNPHQYDDLVLFMGAAFLEHQEQIDNLTKEINSLTEEVHSLKQKLAEHKKKTDSFQKELGSVRKAVSFTKKIKGKFKTS